MSSLPTPVPFQELHCRPSDKPRRKLRRVSPKSASTGSASRQASPATPVRTLKSSLSCLKVVETFRGAGVPDEFITYMRSLVGRAIEYYSCFISHSSKDKDFAERLHADLQDKGVRCWYAPEDVQGGRKLHEQIDEAIRYHDKLLLVLSENSMGSEWVKTEIRRARREEVKAGRRKLFPISLAPFSAIRDWEAFDADIGKDMAVEVREYFIPDFSCWKEHDAYRKAFTRLLRDLKAGEMPSKPAPERQPGAL